ncbi:MAG: hypothetical protein ABL309_06685 [Phycisphaerales bacterium]
MPRVRVTHHGLIDAVVWLLETILCAAIFSAFVGCFFGELIEDSGWRPMLIFS